MLTVGITGGIGSGKSYVAQVFEKHKIPCYYSDFRAKQLMNTHPTIREQIIDTFGKDAYQNNELNRALIAEKVFNNKAKLNWLNSLVHPAVANDFEQWKINNSNTPYVLKEAAILIESGAYKSCDEIIVVTAPEEIRIQRVIERDGMNESQIRERIRNQITDKERFKYANFSINNNGIENVEEQIIKIHQSLINRIK